MKIANIFSLILLAVYAFFVFYFENAPYFNPNYAGMDARQQLFPLYEVLHPGLFGDDYIFRSMSLYIGQLHWFIASLIVRLTGSPIMTGHFVMSIQLSLACYFIFQATRAFSSIPAACVSLAWLLHTPWLVRNTFGGLPRGWAGGIIAAFIYFLAKKNHKAILALILAGSLLHPHSTFLICAAYSFFLAYNLLIPATRSAIRKPLIMFVFFCPLVFAVNYFSVKRPADIGTMVTLEQAKNIPAFSKEGGRFPFVPLDSPMTDFKRASLRIFFEYDAKNPGVFRDRLIIGLLLFYAIAIGVQIFRKKDLLPLELRIYPFAVLTAYFIARVLAFRLYVPVRYMGWPLSIFFMVSIPVILWRMFSSDKVKGLQWKPLAALAVFVGLMYAMSGTNIGGGSSYRPSDGFDNQMYSWIRANTPQTAVLAGQPSAIDGMQLYGMRRAFITTETAHPFYDKYNEEIERRIKVTFKALYAKDKEDFLQAISKDKIDYFVFTKKFFKLNGNGNKPTFKFATYYLPHGNFVKKIASKPANEYFYAELQNYPASIVYQSKDAIIVDVSKLKP